MNEDNNESKEEKTNTIVEDETKEKEEIINMWKKIYPNNSNLDKDPNSSENFEDLLPDKTENEALIISKIFDVNKPKGENDKSYKEWYNSLVEKIKNDEDIKDILPENMIKEIK